MNKNFKYFLSIFLVPILFSYANFVSAMLMAPEPDLIISEDTVWTKDNSPYIISNWIELIPNKTLIIEPGTKIEFNDDKSSLTILGKLIVNGTEDEPVYFNSGYNAPDFKRTSIGFYYEGSAEFKNTIISSGETCLNFLNNVSVSIFDRVKILNCDKGIFSMNGKILITNSEISGNNIGISADNSNIEIKDSSIVNNYEFAIKNNLFETLSPIIKAVGNWWGTADGPYYQNFNDDEISSVYNKVSQNVEYDPWLLSEPVNEKVSLASSTEYENDLNQDDKGIADKTIFTFETIYKNNKNISPDSAYLIIENPDLSTSSLILNLENKSEETDFINGEKFFATSTFPKGNYIYYFEVRSGDNILKSATSSIKTGYSNVAFLPGLEASRLYINDNGEEKMLWQPGLSDENEYLSLDENGNSIKSGIYTKDVIDYAYVLVKGNIYKSFISNMNDIKEEGLIKDWAVIPYDWRMSVGKLLDNGYKDENGNIYYFDENTNFSDPYIISEIRRLASSSDTGKINIIAHSNGGLVTKQLTKRLGDEASKLIENIIFIAVPQVGTPQAIGSLLHGFDEGFPMKIAPLFFTAEDARNLGKNMVSAYGLVPSEKYFDYVSTPVISFNSSEFLKNWIEKYGEEIKTSSALYNFIFDDNREVLEIKNELSALPILNKNLYNQAVDLHSSLDNREVPEGVSLIEIAGWGEQTLSGIEYYQGIKTECISSNDISGCTKYNKIPILEYKPKLTVNGDGTVVVPSALWTASSTNVNKYWVNLQEYGGSDYGTTINREHADILEIPELNNFIKNIIIQNTNSLPKYISASAPISNDLEKSLSFTLHSPLTLDLYDENGNHTGISTTTNEIEENIPGSNYLEFGEVKYISVPASTTVYLSMQGYSSGSFTLNIDELEGNDVVASTTFAGIPSASSTIVTMSITNGDLASTTPLLVDMYGDGKNEMSLQLKVGEVVEIDLLNKKTSNHHRRIYEEVSTSSENVTNNFDEKNNSDNTDVVDDKIKSNNDPITIVDNSINSINQIISTTSVSLIENKVEEKVNNKIAEKIKKDEKKPLIIIQNTNNNQNLVASVGNVSENSLTNKIILFVKKLFTKLLPW